MIYFSLKWIFSSRGINNSPEFFWYDILNHRNRPKKGEQMAQEKNNNNVSESKFYMLRSLIAMAHADDIVTEEEQAYIKELMSKIPLNVGQQEILKEDLIVPQNLEDLLPHIKEPRYRGQLVHFARLMAYKDGNFDPPEHILLDKMKITATSQIDMDAIRADAKKAVQLELDTHDIETNGSQGLQKGGKSFSYLKWLETLTGLWD